MQRNSSADWSGSCRTVSQVDNLRYDLPSMPLDMSGSTRWIQFQETVEYTDAPTPEPAPVLASGITCPQCGRGLEENAKSCASCGWVQPEMDTAEGKAS